MARSINWWRSLQNAFEVKLILEDIPATSAHYSPDQSKLKYRSKRKKATEPIVKAALDVKEQIVITAQVRSFELQMYVLENCAILLETSQLSDARVNFGKIFKR